jgi:glycosyltransferase involved in cell wall biosynthesis
MKLSVIVCTYNRAYALTPCLDSIAASLKAAAPVEAEIVVVDNASTDDTSAVVKKWAETSAFPLRLLHEPKKGLSAARNCALRGAQGELLVFTDDDCRLSVDYVAQALRYDAADSGPVLRGGRVELGDPTDLPLTIKTDSAVIRWHQKRHPAGHKWLGDSILGCNMVLRRETAARIGFFDERLGAGSPLPGGEETDYIFRAYFSGITIEYVPDMAVFHHHGRKKPAEANRLMHNYALGTGALYAKYLFSHPALCRQFWWDFKKALKEIASGKNDFLPDIGFGHRHWVGCGMLGALKYFIVAMRRGPQ